MNSLTPPDSENHEMPSSSGIPQCACLSSMYLTLSNLQSLTNFQFPFAMRPLQEALGTAEGVLDCDHCPRDASSAMLNVNIVTSLLFTIAQRFRVIVEEIDAEASRIADMSGTKRFQLGDGNPENHHMHTAMPDCPAKFDLELDAEEWRAMAKKVVKREVYGVSNEDGSSYNGLVGVVSRLEQRQLMWHGDPDKMRMQDSIFGMHNMHKARKEGDWQCLKQAVNVKTMIDNIPW